MKMFVTGLSGLIGSRIASLARPESLVSLDLPDGVDITRLDDLMRATEAGPEGVGESAPRALIHLAAFTDVNAAYEQRGDRSGSCYALNVNGTENVVRICSERGLHLIHVSTDFVFDGEKESAYTENDAPNPIEWYGQTKLEAEEAARSAPSWTLVRLAFPYAAGATPRPDFIRGFLGRLRSGDTLNLFNDQTITPTFADDVAGALLLLAETRPEGETFHVVGGTATSPYEIGLELARAFDLDSSKILPSSLENYLKTNSRPRQRRLAISNAKWSAYAGGHGTTAPLSLSDGLARVRDSLRESDA